MACDSNGKLYGISASTATEGNNGGILYEINKTTGTLREIGDTQVSPKYTQSAVINTSDNTFYWFANEEDEAANLYTVDLTTGKPLWSERYLMEIKSWGLYSRPRSS